MTTLLRPRARRKHKTVRPTAVAREAKLAQLYDVISTAYQGTMACPGVTLTASSRVFMWVDLDGHTYLGNCRAFYEYLCVATDRKPSKYGHCWLSTLLRTDGFKSRRAQKRDGRTVGTPSYPPQKARKVRVK